MRSRARDSKRISDLKQIATTLELYYADHNSYPTTITFGSPLVGATNGKTYMAKVPTNPTPRAEGACADLEYQYAGSASDFSLIGCLAKASGEATAGYRKLTKNGASNNFGPVAGLIEGQARDLGPMAGIVAWWMLDATNGTTDIGGSGTTGTNTDAVLTTGRYGGANGAYSFNGSSSKIDTNISMSLSASDFTISAWFRGTVPVCLVTQTRVVSPYASDFLFGYGSNNILVWMHGIGTGVTSGISGDPTNWYHITMVWNRTALTYTGYINAASPVTSATVPELTGFGGVNSIKIGARGDGASPFANGSISDVRIYNRALSATEVEALYNATKP
jgi:hypothetical protein